MDDAGRMDIQDVCNCQDPSFVALHPRMPIAYAVNELPAGHGRVTMIGIGDERLEVRQHVGSGGDLPCHVSVLADARAIAVAHYGCGTISVFDLDAGGALTRERTAHHHVGRSGTSPRQAAAHAHCVVATPDALYVTDLGMNCVVVYSADGRDERSRCTVHAGAGPRHLCFDATNTQAWLSNELDNTVSVLDVEADGALKERVWLSTLPDGAATRSAVSELALHNSGEWLYVGNRGHDSLAWYRVAAHGALTWRGAVSTQGGHPRHFALSADGDILLVANRDSNALVPFRIDRATGEPQPLVAPFVGVPAPVCVRWL